MARTDGQFREAYDALLDLCAGLGAGEALPAENALRFHAAVNGVVRNRFVVEFQRIVALIFHYHYMGDKTEEKARNRVAIGEHLAIIDALLARDLPAAERAALSYLASSKATLLASLRGNRLA